MVPLLAEQAAIVGKCCAMSPTFHLTRRHFIVAASALTASCATGNRVGPAGKPPVSFVASPNFGDREGARIDSVVMHFTQATFDGTIRQFLDRRSEVSAHYVIARDGTIVQMVADRDRAWHAKRIMNPRSIGIEHEAAPHQPMAPAQEAASVALLRWLLAEYGVSPANIFGHRFTPLNEGATDCPSGLFGDETKEAVDAWVGRHFAT